MFEQQDHQTDEQNLEDSDLSLENVMRDCCFEGEGYIILSLSSILVGWLEIDVSVRL